MADTEHKSMSRADALRARRTSQGTTRISRAADLATSPVFTTPVISRNSMAGMPMVQKSRKTNRKKVYYTKNSAGAEVRLPAIPIIHPGWRLLSFTVAAASLAIIYFMWTAPLFKVQAASVTGSERLTADDINSSLKLTGKRIIEISPDKLGTQIQASFPEIKSVSVTEGLPAMIKVNIEERKPIIAWDEYGTTKWIDDAGYSFSPRGDAPDLISVNASANSLPAKSQKKTKGNASDIQVGDQNQSSTAATSGSGDQPYMDSEMVTAIRTMAARAPQGAQIVYNPSYGLGWYDSNGWNVYFGLDLVNVDAKMTMYDAIKKKLLDNNEQPKLISLEYIDAPFYR